MSELSDRVASLELAVLAIATQRFEDVGHEFHGNQYTGGQSDEPRGPALGPGPAFTQNRRVPGGLKALPRDVAALDRRGNYLRKNDRVRLSTGGEGAVVHPGYKSASTVAVKIDGEPATGGDGKPWYRIVDASTVESIRHLAEPAPRVPNVTAEVERARREREDRMIENTDPAVARRISSMSGPQGEAARRNYISSGTDPSWYGG